MQALRFLIVIVFARPTGIFRAVRIISQQTRRRSAAHCSRRPVGTRLQLFVTR